MLGGQGGVCVAVYLVWGFNFLVIHHGSQGSMRLIIKQNLPVRVWTVHLEYLQVLNPTFVKADS